MKRYCIGLIIGLALTAGTAFSIFQKIAPNFVFFKASEKNPIERIVRVLERLDNSKNFQQLQGAIDELLADGLCAEEDREIKELDRKNKQQNMPKPTTIG